MSSAARRRERYATDPEYRAKTLARSARWWRINGEREKAMRHTPEYRAEDRLKRKLRKEAQCTTTSSHSATAV